MKVQEMEQLLEQFVRTAGGTPVFTWVRGHTAAAVDAMVVCTNEARTGLVVGVIDTSGDGAVITLPDEQVQQLVGALRSWDVNQ